MPYDPETGAYIEESAGTDERTDLAAGGAEPAAQPEGLDPRILSRELFDRRVRQGAPRDEAASDAFALLAQAGIAGDRRVIVGPDWTPMQYESDPGSTESH